jgi:hypothetical protein
MARTGPLLALAAALGLAMAVGGGKKRRPSTTYDFPPEDVTPDPPREPEGGSDPEPPPPGEEIEPIGGDIPEILNLMNVSPPEKRKGSRVPWAIVLHQMSFSRGNDPYDYKKVTAHYIITPDGTIAQLHPITAYLYAADGFNEGGISIEFAGNFPTKSQSTNPKNFYHPDDWVDKEGVKHEGMGMDQLTPSQIMAGRWLVEHLYDNVLPEIGSDLTVILAHRQSGEQRQNDPGPDVWANVGQWAVDELGLSDGGPGFAVGGGNPIPDTWRSAPKIA